MPPGVDLPNIAPTQISPGVIPAGLAQPPLSPEVSSKIFSKLSFHQTILCFLLCAFVTYHYSTSYISLLCKMLVRREYLLHFLFVLI